MVASLGFLPMALSHGSGAEVQKPLATVVIGGLLSATLLTLLVLPVLYILSENGFKFRTPKAVVILLPLFLLLGYPNASKAQILKTVTLNEAIDLALKQNNAIKSAQYQILYKQRLVGTATDIGKTNVSLGLGKDAQGNPDNNYSASQTIPFPTLMHRQAQYYNSAKEGAEINMEVAQNELVLNIKTIYNTLQSLKAKQKLLLNQDSIYVQFNKAADLRFRTGESNALEKSTAESQLFENRTLLEQNAGNIGIYENQLQVLVTSTEPITSVGAWEKQTLLVFQDSSVMASNPNLRYIRHQIELAEKSTKIEKSRFLPDITLGWFYQSIGLDVPLGQGRVVSPVGDFQGLLVGFSVPLWSGPQIAKVRANQMMTKIAESNAMQYQTELQGKLQQSFKEYQKFKNSLEYYEKNALPTADIITQNALKNYQSGNIGYIEFSQGLTRALGIRTNYLNILSQYNQSIINIEFLIGNK
ncbi:MAG: TolC family protein, partial [Cytophagales bacterium]|nr:TolC family protein [Cytophagales bacterium]